MMIRGKTAMKKDKQKVESLNESMNEWIDEVFSWKIRAFVEY